MMAWTVQKLSLGEKQSLTFEVFGSFNFSDIQYHLVGFDIIRNLKVLNQKVLEMTPLARKGQYVVKILFCSHLSKLNQHFNIQ